jgi:predicted lysophospholipase L1 biosynthesis ABC-type transport system permease subunit
VRQNFVSADYFETAGVRLVRGRGFRDTDVATAQQVAIVNETMARHYFGDADPIGRMVYFPALSPIGRGLGVIAVRTATGPEALAGDVRRAIGRVHPDLTSRISTLEDDIRGTLAQEHLVTRLLSFFGAAAILLACIGVYGVVAYTVVQRWNEIGVRIALGARRQQIVNMVASYTLRLAALGIALGFGAAFGTTRFLDTLLFGLTPTDSTTLALAAVVMIAVALLAAAIPAVRAARLNPILVLRRE